MKRIISLILCILMLVPMLTYLVSAEEAADEGAGEGTGEGTTEENKAFNFAVSGSAYATSKWNNDSDPKYINNKVIADSYKFWRPDGHGRDIYMDDSEQICGLRYQDGNYYNVQEIVIYTYMESPTNNIKYTIEALVLGEWKEIGFAYNQDCEHTGLEPAGKGKGEVGKLTIKATNPDDATQPVITKHIRLKVSEYGRWANNSTNKNPDGSWNNAYDNPNTEVYDPQSGWHNWHLVPIIHELETWGTVATKDQVPTWDVPEGAILSTNACLSGFAHATSTYDTRNIYPALVNDDVKYPTLSVARPYWQAKSALSSGNTEQVWCEFDKLYDITNVALNFGGVGADNDGITLKYSVDIQVLKDGKLKWESIATDKTVTATEAEQQDVLFDFSTFGGTQSIFTAKAVRVTFTEAKGTNGRNARPLLTEMSANISPTNVQKDEQGNKIYNDKGETIPEPKCIFLKDFVTASKKASASVGNLAIFGTAYASSLMSYANISSIDYINDGGTHRDLNNSWFAETFEKGTYCGVELQKSFMVDKVVLYFADPVTGGVDGNCVMEFDIQFKVGANYQTVKQGVTSYDATNKQYIVSVELETPIQTNDVRIVYTANGLVFPYIKELEVYSSKVQDAENGASYESYDSYTGYPEGDRTMLGKEANKAEDLAKKSTVLRSKYLDKISPIEYFEITQKYGIEVQSWQ